MKLIVEQCYSIDVTSFGYYPGQSHVSRVLLRPEDTDVSLWRYVDLSQYISMLDNSELFFARADGFADDPFEGSRTHADVARHKALGDAFSENVPGMIAALIGLARRSTIINCWHENEDESAAMWKLYVASGQGLAIRSTFQRVTSSLPTWKEGDDGHQIHAGRVSYIDYHSDVIPDGNTFWPFVHKRKSFAHECEVRLIAQDLFKGRDEAGWDPKTAEGIPKPGVTVPVSLETLIADVRVAPAAPEWFRRVVESVTKRYGYEFSVSQSSLDDAPVY